MGYIYNVIGDDTDVVAAEKHNKLFLEHMKQATEEEIFFGHNVDWFLLAFEVDNLEQIFDQIIVEEFYLKKKRNKRK